VYVGTVRSGEATGQLDTVLDQTVKYLERDMNTRRRVRETLRYPVMVIVAITLAAGVIVKFVVPRFLAFYTHFGSQLPTPTRLVLAAAGLFSRFWWVPLLGVIVTAIFWRQWMKTAAGERWRDRMLLRIPLAGSLFLKVAVSRFARLFGLLYSAGIPVTAALETAAAGVGNVVVASEVCAMRERLTAGEPVSSIPPRAVIPGLVYQMLGIGFESAEVERMLAEVARHYEQEVDYDIRRLSDRLQPILLACLAAGVLLLALSVFLPIWNLITLFKQ